MRPQNLAKIVNERMRVKDISAYRLSKLSGVTRQTVGNFITEESAITSDKLSKILAALDLIVMPVEGKE
jgi:plasmid maintenance system antidote protein VapI